MFLTSSTVFRSRVHALHNLAELTAAQIDIVERVSDLVASTTRASFDRIGQKGFAAFTPNTSDSSLEAPIAVQFIDQMFEITGDSQKALIKTAEAQIHMVDEMIFAAIERVKNFSPREIEGGLETMNIALRSAEDTLHEASSRALNTLELSEQEFHQAALMAGQASAKKTTRAPSAKTRKTAELPDAAPEA